MQMSQFPPVDRVWQPRVLHLAIAEPYSSNPFYANELPRSNWKWAGLRNRTLRAIALHKPANLKSCPEFDFTPTGNTISAALVQHSRY